MYGLAGFLAVMTGRFAEEMIYDPLPVGESVFIPETAGSPAESVVQNLLFGQLLPPPLTSSRA